MRKLFAGMMVYMLMLALTACGNAEDNHLGELSHSAQSTEENNFSKDAFETDSKPETEGITAKWRTT